MDGKVFSRSASKKMGIFLAEKVKKQKETPPKGCLMKCYINKALQRRVIRVSETFERQLKQRGRPSGAQRKAAFP